MKNNSLKNLLFKRFSAIDLFISGLAYIIGALFPWLKNDGSTALPWDGTPFDD